jgi:hypothetical protein
MSTIYFDKWPAIKEFHGVMSDFHPAERKFSTNKSTFRGNDEQSSLLLKSDIPNLKQKRYWLRQNDYN